MTCSHTSSAPGFQVRTADRSDATAIARLSGVLGYDATAAEIRPRLEEFLGRDDRFVGVAYNDDALLGWIAMERRLILESGESAEIVGLVVTADARRRGIGRALIRAAESWASARQLMRVPVRSNTAREASHRFYRSLGYEPVKSQEVYRKAMPRMPSR